MQTICNTEFGGERPLFGSHSVKLENVVIHAGESAIKEGSDIIAINCRFEGKYPFWHINRFNIKNCLFTEGARAALWYSHDLLMEDTVVDAPKMFRDMTKIKLQRVKLTDALETLWNCKDIEFDDVTVDHGDYLFMHSENIKINNYRHNGNYAFQYCKNIEIKNAVLNAKDSFWNSENITVYDSEINGEYLGWHSKNLRLVNCKLSGTQPLCYADNLILENCSFASDSDLAFEYSTLNAKINGKIPSVKNPTSGKIEADEIGEIILDNNIRQPADCKITVLKS